jgi:hypothetical protein
MSSPRDANGAVLKVFRAERSTTSASFAAPVSVEGLNSSSDDSFPIITNDETLVYFASGRGETAGYGDIWMSQRALVTDGFATPVRIDELASGVDEAPTWLSADRCRLYFYRASGDGGGAYDLFVAAKPEP